MIDPHHVIFRETMRPNYVIHDEKADCMQTAKPFWCI
jgi:hypothetical protein